MREIIYRTAIFLLLLTCNAAAYDWITYKNAEGNFVIEFPGQPEIDKSKQATIIGELDGPMFVVEKDVHEFFLGYMDIPDNILPYVGIENSLKGAMLGSVTELEAEIIDAKPN